MKLDMLGKIKSLVIIYLWKVTIIHAIIFTKTMDGESYKKNILPSLVNSISRIVATSEYNGTLSYSIDSEYFVANKTDGRIYLISELRGNDVITYYSFNISASDQKYSVILQNTISIIDVNNNAPTFETVERVFEVSEDQQVKSNIKVSNGTMIALKLSDLDSSNRFINVKCINPNTLYNPCETFQFVQNTIQTNGKKWTGHIRLNNELNFNERKIYRLVASAQDDAGNMANQTFLIKITPSMKIAPKVLNSMLIFDIDEKKPIYTKITIFSLPKKYEELFGSQAVYNIVQDIDEVRNIQDYETDEDATQNNLDLSNKYLQVTNSNELVVRMTADRDSNELILIDSILKFWVKVSYLNESNFSYQKVYVVINDVNDNKPTFGQFDHVLSAFTENKLKITADISENAIGAINFDNQILAYDLDLGENSAFSIELSPDFNIYIKSDPLINQDSSNLNLILKSPFDFESLGGVLSIDPVTGLAKTSLNISLTAKEIMSAERYESLPFTFILNIYDLNDNQPKFEQSIYKLNLNEDSNAGTNDLEILKFSVTDLDSGVYGLNGLVCRINGEGSEKFRVDSILQKLYLLPCLISPCFNYQTKNHYDLTLICHDNNGNGNSAYTKILVNVNSSQLKAFTFTTKIFYLFVQDETLPSISRLKFQPIIYNSLNSVKYKITDTRMAQFFNVDNFGIFRIVSNSLTMEESLYKNGTFIVPIQATDAFGTTTDDLKVIVQVGDVKSLNKCPKISEQAQCTFIINGMIDKDSMRFCFYGPNQIVTDLDGGLNSSPTNTVVFALSSDSPSYLIINPSDGCIKISSYYDFDYTINNRIHYSVGVFNPNFPECISGSLVDCTISINKSLTKAPTCKSDIPLSPSYDYYKITANSFNDGSSLTYSILNEEILYTNGRYLNMTNNFSYNIDKLSGELRLNTPLDTSDVMNIVMTINVKDTTNLGEQNTTCSVYFNFLPKTSPLKFPGTQRQIVNICEDVPINSQIMTLNIFDSKFTGRLICYSINQNDYFQLLNGNGATNGDVILTKTLDYESLKLLKNTEPTISLNANAFFCDDSSTSIKQNVTIKILNVNEYAPTILHNSVEPLSLNPTGNFTTRAINVVDVDAFPFNIFNCTIENDQRFNIISLNNTILIQYTPLEGTYLAKYTDLSIKCCDVFTNLTNYNLTRCLPLQKCSTSPVRIQFIDSNQPISCANNEQDIYFNENMQATNMISSVVCISNNTNEPIKYELANLNDYFSINSTTGSINIKKALNGADLNGINLLVQCSNGIVNNTCKVKIKPSTGRSNSNTKSKWINPGPTDPIQCITVEEDIPIGSVIAGIKAIPADNTQTVQYFFYLNGLTSSVYEFEIRNNLIGDIYLNKPLNRSIDTLREITLAARSVLNNSDFGSVSYQYLCIRILLPKTFQPCLKDLTSESNDTLKIYLTDTIEMCFYAKQIQARNIDTNSSQFYYYFVPKNAPYEAFLYSFDYNSGTSSICLKSNTFDITSNIFGSKYRYYDKEIPNQICYDTAMIVSRYDSLSLNDLTQIKYDKKNCSFYEVTFCFDEFAFQDISPFMTDSKCEKTISMHKLSPYDVTCLNQFEIENSNPKLNYKIKTTANVQQPSSIKFSTDESTNCLYISEIRKTIIENYFKFNVSLAKNTTNDILNFNKCCKPIVEPLTCNVYVTKSCAEEIYILVDESANFVRDNSDAYISTLSEFMSYYFSAQVITRLHKVLHYSSSIDKQKISRSLILVSLYDKIQFRFLNNKEVIDILNANVAQSIPFQQLSIRKFLDSCASIKAENKSGIISILSILGLFLGLLCCLIPLLCCCLSYMFENLKLRKTKVILTEHIIPILSDASLGQQANILMAPTQSNMSVMERSVISNQSPYGSFDQPEEIFEEIIEQEPTISEKVIYKTFNAPFEIHNNTNGIDVMEQSREGIISYVNAPMQFMSGITHLPPAPQYTETIRGGTTEVVTELRGIEKIKINTDPDLTRNSSAHYYGVMYPPRGSRNRSPIKNTKNEMDHSKNVFKPLARHQISTSEHTRINDRILIRGNEENASRNIVSESVIQEDLYQQQNGAENFHVAQL